jgi:hypothetical protein
MYWSADSVTRYPAKLSDLSIDVKTSFCSNDAVYGLHVYFLFEGKNFVL